MDVGNEPPNNRPLLSLLMTRKSRGCKQNSKNLKESGIVPRSLGKEDSEHDVSLKPFIGALRVLSPSRRA